MENLRQGQERHPLLLTKYSNEVKITLMSCKQNSFLQQRYSGWPGCGCDCDIQNFNDCTKRLSQLRPEAAQIKKMIARKPNRS